MTDKLRAAAQMALEALEWSWGGEPIGTMEIDAINALRAALSEPLTPVCEAALKPAASEVSGSTPAAWISERNDLQLRMGDRPGANWRPLYAHPPAQQPQWTPIADGLPASGRTVLACYTNRVGNVRRIRAHWVAAKTSEASDESEFSEYDEDTDTYYSPEGWYENIDNWGDYSSVFVCEGEVTHWMPLPDAPAAIGGAA